MKRTPLYEKHVQLGGRIVEFGGWELPVQYTGIIEEHMQVRNAAGLFDVSHMGEIWVEGTDAERFLQRLLTNDISKAVRGQAVYSPVCYPDGGTVDDLLIYKYSSDRYLLVVNASNTEKDFEWIKENLQGDCTAVNVSDEYAELALQGPGAVHILQKLTETPLDALEFFHFIPDIDVGGLRTVISRSGYTGEDGFELYIRRADASELWDKITDAGFGEGLVPVGLGARDTLRFEAALPLYGHELSEDISPLEAGLNRFVKPDKPDFIGRTALLEQKQIGLKRHLAGFEMLDKGVARNKYAIEVNGQTAGFVTTGSYSPSLHKNLGLAMIDSAFTDEGTQIDVIIRGKSLKAQIVKLPFYKKRYRRNK